MNTEQVLPTAQLGPISASKRIDVMDILRGFALIGIILMNIEWFGRFGEEAGRFDFSLTGADWGAGWFIRLFVEGKFYKLFSLLFGMGFAVMLLRAQEVGRPFGAWFVRRMLVLFTFGMAHLVFLWDGDILHDYAVGGLMLLGWVFIVRHQRMGWFCNPRSFMRLGVVILSLPFIIALGASFFFGATRTQDVMAEALVERKAVIAEVEIIKTDENRGLALLAKAKKESKADGNAKDIEEVDEDAMSAEQKVIYNAEKRFVSEHKRQERKDKELEVLSQGSYWQVVDLRLGEVSKVLKRTPIAALLMGFPLFLIGYWFIASGIFREPKKHINLFKSMTWIGLGTGLFISAGALLLMTHPVTENANGLIAISNVMFMFAQLPMTAGYLGAIVLICLTVRGNRWLSWLAPMGRMALTNYIMHSVILTSIFYGYAGGLYGHVSRFGQVGLVVAIIASQALLSRFWLKHFQFGPLEWLWRSMTYMKMQPMRVEKPQT